MRIAICFSGQLRTGVESSYNLLNFFGDSLPDCDFFIHTWNINTTKPYNGIIENNELEFVSNEYIEKIKSIYNPKEINVENFFEFNQKYPQRFYISELWYSFMKSVEMKRNFEIKNNFTYDYVVKLRPDIIFHPDRKLMDDIKILSGNQFYIENFYNEMHDGRLWSDDVYFFSNSINMDNASKFYDVAIDTYYRYENRGDGDSSKFYIFTDHLIKHNIEITSAYNWREFHQEKYRYAIYRKECFEFSPMTDFMDCFYCDHHFFDANINKDDAKTYYINTLKKYKQ